MALEETRARDEGSAFPRVRRPRASCATRTWSSPSPAPGRSGSGSPRRRSTASTATSAPASCRARSRCRCRTLPASTSPARSTRWARAWTASRSVTGSSAFLPMAADRRGRGVRHRSGRDSGGGAHEHPAGRRRRAAAGGSHRVAGAVRPREADDRPARADQRRGRRRRRLRRAAGQERRRVRDRHGQPAQHRAGQGRGRRRGHRPHHRRGDRGGDRAGRRRAQPRPDRPGAAGRAGHPDPCRRSAGQHHRVDARALRRGSAAYAASTCSSAATPTNCPGWSR